MTHVNHTTGEPDYEELQSAPEDVRSIWAAADQLAASDASSAPAGLEDRVFAASVGALGEPGAVIARIGSSSSWKWRLAASLAVVGGIGAMAWFALRANPGSFQPGQTPAVVESGDEATQPAADTALAELNSEFEQWLSDAQSATEVDAELATLSSTLDSIQNNPFELVSSDSLSASQEPSL